MSVINTTSGMENCVSPDSLYKAVKVNDVIQARVILQSLNESNKKIVLEWQSKPAIRTPLMQCALDRNHHLARLLVAAGANIFATDFTGTSPFSYALDIHTRNLDMVEIFLKTPDESMRKKLNGSC